MQGNWENDGGGGKEREEKKREVKSRFWAWKDQV